MREFYFAGWLLEADKEFVKYLSETGYHPRSSKHGDKLCQLLVADLKEECLAFKGAIQEGRICFDLNYSPATKVPLGWNIDLVVGPAQDRRLPVSTLLREAPSELWIAVDAKTIMTEHGKARRNRQRDLNSFATILHMKNPKTIVGGLVVINLAESFRSPLRNGETTVHANISRLVEGSVRLFEELPKAPRSGLTGGNLNQIDALGIIVVRYTNKSGEQATLVTDPPAPQPSSPVHYSNFVKDICRAFGERFTNIR